MLALTLLSFTAMAGILLEDKFDGALNTANWAPSDPKAIRVEKGLLVLDQKGSGQDWVGVNTTAVLPDCVIYYKWVLAEYSGTGDCGGALRQNPAGEGSYRMRWGWGNTVNLVDNIDHAPVKAWTAFPGCSSPYPATSKNFELKASLVTPTIKVKIKDLDTGKMVADWNYKDDWYKSGRLQFEVWKFGIVHVDNVVVATPDMEAKIFADSYNPEGAVSALDPVKKLTVRWGEIKE